MKQNITEKQLNELKEDAIRELQEWGEKHNCDRSCQINFEDWDGVRKYYPPLLSIGQMIEFLDDFKIECALFSSLAAPPLIYKAGWCDALWEAVKEVLEK